MSRKWCFVNRNSGRKFEEVFDSFIIAKTAKGVSDVTIRNYHQNLHASYSNKLDFWDSSSSIVRLSDVECEVASNDNDWRERAK